MSLKDTIAALSGRATEAKPGKAETEEGAAPEAEAAEQPAKAEAAPAPAPADPENEDEEEKTEASASAASKARAEERKRISAILHAGSHAPALAAHLAFETEMTADQAKAALASAPKSGTTGFAAAMATQANPDLGSGARATAPADHNSALVDFAKKAAAARDKKRAA